MKDKTRGVEEESQSVAPEAVATLSESDTIRPCYFQRWGFSSALAWRECCEEHETNGCIASCMMEWELDEKKARTANDLTFGSQEIRCKKTTTKK